MHDRKSQIDFVASRVGKNTLHCVLFILVALAVSRSIAAVAEPTATPFGYPVAAAYLRSIGLVILARDGTVTTLNTNLELNSKPQFVVDKTKSFHIPFNQSPVDMALGVAMGKQGDEPFIFITSNKNDTFGGGRTGGEVTQYRLNGERVNGWHTQGLSTGIDFDEGSQTLYVADVDENEILSIALTTSVRKGDSTPKHFATVGQIGQIGPIALDSTQHIIWCGDIFDRGIYALDLNTRRSRLQATHLGQVSGILVDPASGHIYATDLSRNLVQAFDRRGNELQPGQVLKPAKNPSAVAMLADGTIVVANQLDGLLLFFKPTGESLGWISGK